MRALTLARGGSPVSACFKEARSSCFFGFDGAPSGGQIFFLQVFPQEN